MAIQTEKPIECVGCNTFDMKSLFDNSDCSLPIEQFYATRQDAEGALEYFTLKHVISKVNLAKFSLKFNRLKRDMYLKRFSHSAAKRN